MLAPDDRCAACSPSLKSLDASVEGGSGHAEIFRNLRGRPAVVDEAHGVANLAVCEHGRRPPRSLPAARRFEAESPMRSRFMSSSIWARAAMTVKTSDPIGVDVSTSPPPRFSTRRPAPRFRSSAAKASMAVLRRDARQREQHVQRLSSASFDVCGYSDLSIRRGE